MRDELKRLMTECWRSRMGRAFFLFSVLATMTMVGWAWNNMRSPYLPDARRIFFYLHWFSIIRVERLYVWFGRPAASQLYDGFLAFLFSIPWWFYGYGVEVLGAKIRRMLSASE